MKLTFKIKEEKYGTPQYMGGTGKLSGLYIISYDSFSNRNESNKYRLTTTLPGLPCKNRYESVDKAKQAARKHFEEWLSLMGIKAQVILPQSKTWSRKCKECGHRQTAKHPTEYRYFHEDSYNILKCRTCKSHALDYGTYDYQYVNNKWIDLRE